VHVHASRCNTAGIERLKEGFGLQAMSNGFEPGGWSLDPEARTNPIGSTIVAFG
jgi:hypothetical protein